MITSNSLYQVVFHSIGDERNLHAVFYNRKIPKKYILRLSEMFIRIPIIVEQEHMYMFIKSNNFVSIYNIRNNTKIKWTKISAFWFRCLVWVGLQFLSKARYPTHKFIGVVRKYKKNVLLLLKMATQCCRGFEDLSVFQIQLHFFFFRIKFGTMSRGNTQKKYFLIFPLLTMICSIWSVVKNC